MNTVIWKYELLGDVTHHPMPVGAEILTVQSQGGDMCLWAAVDPKAEREARSFVVVGTGHEKDFDLKKENYLGTVQQLDGQLIWHVFEYKNN